MRAEDLAKLIIKELKEVNKNFDANESSNAEIVKSKEDIRADIENLENSNTNDEKIFLENVKERILVLFEGLNNFDKGDIEARVELNLKFMEFLLATIEDRLKKL